MSDTALPRPRRERRSGPRAAPRLAAWPLPWRDRGGRFSWFKALAFLGTLVPAGILAGRWMAMDLGPEPYTEAIHVAGLWAIRFLAISLVVTPLRRLADWPRVVLLRRMLGLAALAYALLHVALYAADQQFRLWHVLSEMLRRNYLTLGLVAVIILCTLGWTSTDGWLRRLGRDWKRLHRLVFAAAGLALVHFFLQSKIDVTQAVLMAGLFLWLILWRLLPATWQASLPALLGLAAAAALGTAGIEYAWYALATPIPPLLVLQANLDVSFGLRPALWVGIAGLGAAALVPLRRLVPAS
ncbi:ferric reductase-like transmembrane domain-containing protein [Roseomonas sp. OT10]|uniref:sulfite oxidase heme-binding subunit YedZ n=1 Tax=Roseomonas cutis TaxID=2897332 RepID=UPI001E35EE51|nr:ferric reductase-like transmembrane domain-containing protein [Roseomonas sp. OT10]UFN49188.1 ferric reductase-like transmembrane domain-containing protein [Roseomonas sp. OT10]